ncbi:hypothetical protein CC030809_00028 [Synechococcus phage S-CAM7]|uniref:Uncharacterized protein n=1 Tax=Synechococcus phage S-CAM7 TaxID=1883368 RepID=A0A7D5JRS9_9CAUD|nr:hypothetical protein CC030809_00028 [Synechococcus phage S-CAM7]
MDQCSQADSLPTEVNNTLIMENQPLDQYWTTPYGDFAIRKTRFGATLVWMGLNISIVITDSPKDE